MKYKDGVKLGFATNLPTTKAITTGTPADVTVVVSGGNIPYTYSWTKNGAPYALTTATISFTGVAGDAGSYVCTVTDVMGFTITSATMVVTVA
ncbi:phage tail protein [Enterobacteriaceae bacterium RIT711]|nr:phage tail protein [Enterobacteriaceae bacterium RIT711]